MTQACMEHGFYGQSMQFMAVVFCLQEYFQQYFDLCAGNFMNLNPRFFRNPIAPDKNIGQLKTSLLKLTLHKRPSWSYIVPTAQAEMHICRGVEQPGSSSGS